jgi:anti-sigma factor RsiW
MHPNEDILNAYADATLDPGERVDVERHLEACEPCRSLVEDLRAIVNAAATLELRDPPVRAWARIERAIELEAANDGPAKTGNKGPAKAGHHKWRWLAAAAVLVTAVGLTIGRSQFRSTVAERPTASAGPLATPLATTAPDAATNGASADVLESEMRQAEQHYEKAIKGLEQITKDDQGALDGRTAATLQKNLAVIDQAIGESRAAVRSQPANEPAQQSLIENFKTKLSLLEDTVALINEMRKGNEAGTARIVSDLKTKGD